MFTKKQVFYKIIEDLVERGIKVTLEKDTSGEVFADLHSGTESWMWLYPTLVVTGRFDEWEPINGTSDLLRIFVDRYSHFIEVNKDTANQKWIDYAVDKGFLKKVETVRYVRP